MVQGSSTPRGDGNSGGGGSSSAAAGAAGAPLAAVGVSLVEFGKQLISGTKEVIDTVRGNCAQRGSHAVLMLLDDCDSVCVMCDAVRSSTLHIRQCMEIGLQEAGLPMGSSTHVCLQCQLVAVQVNTATAEPGHAGNVNKRRAAVYDHQYVC
jgi:hypothetical protein